MERKRVIIIGLLLASAGIIPFVIFSLQFFAMRPSNGGSGDGYISYDSLPSKPVLSDIQPDPSTDGSISLSWTASERVWYYNIWRKKSGSTEDFIKLGTTSSSFIDASTKANGLYYYRIEAVNNIGDIYSSYQSVKIEIAALPTYTREADLYSVVVAVDGEVSLAWSIESGTDHYDYIQRKPDGGSFSKVGAFFMTGHEGTFTDTLIGYGSYAYRIKSVYAGFWGPETYYSKVFWVLFAGIKPNPTVIDPIVPSTDIDGNVDLTWSSVPNVPEYEIYRSKDNGIFTSIITVSIPSYTDPGLADGFYSYKIMCIGIDLNSDYSNTQSVIVQQYVYIPIIPSATTVYTISPNPNIDGVITISWLSISDADDYELYRSKDGGIFSPITTTAETSYPDTVFLDGTYYYKVICRGVDDNSGFSNTQSVKVEIYVAPPPLVLPTNPSIIINNGDLTTDSFDVIITLSCNDANEMRFQISSGVYLDWVPYSTSYTLTLSKVNPDYPNYYIGVTFRNQDGNSGEVFDGIKYEVLDDGNGDGNGNGEESIITPEQIGIIIAVIIIVIPVVVIRALTKKKKIKSK